HESELGGRIIIVKYADERRNREKARAVWAQLPPEEEEAEGEGETDVDVQQAICGSGESRDLIMHSVHNTNPISFI
ncbi:hypothetical protein BVRB_018400, partial [Beta vulgaris subsp. vulgaris]